MDVAVGMYVQLVHFLSYGHTYQHLMIPFGNQMWCVKENDQVLVDFAVEHLRVSSCHISANYILIKEIAMDDVCAPLPRC